jgi:hypothetical protein
MRADLHIHSVYSDGSCFPEELAQKAAANGVELASVTDHDNFAGDEVKRACFSGMGITYLSGVEISAYRDKTKIHMTGYGYDLTSPLLASYQDTLYQNAYLRMQDVIDRLARYKNIYITEEDVLAQQRVKAPVHTMHIVRAIKQKGYYDSYRDIFTDCFQPDRPTYSFLGRPTPETAIEMLHSLGGIICIAHPGRIELPFEEREKLILQLKEEGADGMECVYSTHTKEETEYFSALANRIGLLQSGGSDYHSDLGRRIIGMPVFEPSPAFLERVGIKSK